MVYIICAENYKRTKVSDSGLTNKGLRYRALALRRDGELVTRDFIGFVDRSILYHPRLVKLVNIVAVYNDIEVIEIPRGHWVLGLFDRRAFSVVLECNKPLHHPIDYEKYAKRYENNVIGLGTFGQS